MTSHPIVIVGGGICGLTAALALSQLSKLGRPIHIVERAEAFSAEGAGIQLGPNATRILRWLGLEPALTPRIVEPICVDIRTGRGATLLTRLPIKSLASRRYEAPYWVIHRAALQDALLEKVRASSQISLSMGFDVTAFEDLGEKVCLFGSDGTVIEAAAIVGADGIWSQIRQGLFANAAPVFSGRTAWRRVLPTGSLPSIFTDAHVGLWLGPGGHLVHYPLDDGQLTNIVAVTKSDKQTTGWSEPLDGELEVAFAGWCEPVQALIEERAAWRGWPLYDGAPLAQWHNGRVVLAGDAAHPLLPFFAQAGVMAIEDAYELGCSLAAHGENYEGAWQEFTARRIGRIRRVQQASRRNGQIYHLSGAMAFARNCVLRLTPADYLLKRYDWLYGYGSS